MRFDFFCALKVIEINDILSQMKFIIWLYGNNLMYLKIIRILFQWNFLDYHQIDIQKLFGNQITLIPQKRDKFQLHIKCRCRWKNKQNSFVQERWMTWMKQCILFLFYIPSSKTLNKNNNFIIFLLQPLFKNFQVYHIIKGWEMHKMSIKNSFHEMVRTLQFLPHF